jgi:hypothetical protein
LSVLIFMSSTLCDLCHQQPATVFVTKIVNNHTSKHRLCAECARVSAGNALEAAGELPDMSHLPLEDIVKNLLGNDSLTLWGKNSEDVEIEPDEVTEFSWTMGLGEFPGDEDAVDEIDEADEFDEEASIDGSMLPEAKKASPATLQALTLLKTSPVNCAAATASLRRAAPNAAPHGTGCARMAAPVARSATACSPISFRR